MLLGVTVRFAEAVLLPIRITVVGLSVAPRPEGGEPDSETEPAKLPRLERVIVDVVEEPAATMRVAGVAEMLKSTTLTLTVAAWAREPLVPVTTAVNVPILEELTVRVEKPGPAGDINTGLRLKNAVRPEADTLRVTEPAKPAKLVRVIVEVLEAPTLTISEIGVAKMVKSTTWKVMAAEVCDTGEPLVVAVPVTVTL